MTDSSPQRPQETPASGGAGQARALIVQTAAEVATRVTKEVRELVAESEKANTERTAQLATKLGDVQGLLEKVLKQLETIQSTKGTRGRNVTAEGNEEMYNGNKRAPAQVNLKAALSQCVGNIGVAEERLAFFQKIFDIAARAGIKYSFHESFVYLALGFKSGEELEARIAQTGDCKLPDAQKAAKKLVANIHDHIKHNEEANNEMRALAGLAPLADKTKKAPAKRSNPAGGRKPPQKEKEADIPATGEADYFA